MVASEIEEELHGLDAAWLTGLVRLALGRPAADLVAWHYERIGTGRGSATAGIYRLAGTAQDPDGLWTWSLILKVLSPAPLASDDVTHPLYWQREAMAYRSGLLADLPGELRAPCCYAIIDRPDGSCWLWQEDVQERYGHAWPLEQFRSAARALGRFNGAYLVQRAVPDLPWLTQDTSPRGVLNAYVWVRDLIADPAIWRHHALVTAFPVPLADRLLRLWDERDVLLDVVEQMPYTLCHADAWRCNLFAPGPGVPDPRLVAIDWAYTGHGPLGGDAADLLAPSFGLFGAQTTSLAALEAVICDGYQAGLQASGWQSDPAAVRRASIAYAAVKYGCLQLWLPAVTDAAQRAAWEAISMHRFDDFLRRQAATLYGLFNLLDDVI